MSPRALRFLPLALACASLGGCLDFLDPNLPAPGPALATVSLFLPGNGTVDARVSVAPGMSLAHEWRTIPHDTLLVDSIPVAPTTVHADGTRDYQAIVALPTPVGPVTLQLPAVAGIDQAPPPLRWYALRRLDPDTVQLAPGGDLFLHVDTTKPPETPAPAAGQWVLQLAAGVHSFQLGADGTPPSTLHVPAEFLPTDTSRIITASLLVFHGAPLQSGAEYILNASLNQRLNWVVLRR